MALSDELLKLSQQSKHLEDSVEATKTQNDARLAARKAELDLQLGAARDRLHAKAAQVADDEQAAWADAQKSVSDAFASLRSDASARRARSAAKRAGRAADEAEADAVDAVDFAIYAIQEAEYAVLDAAVARDLAAAKAGDAALSTAQAEGDSTWSQ
ncbi:hypothetical protein [Gryllotalpicola protaetiae]|uniref:Uncharacterized protein n=1 Tax=Gryllotalpicola protaetiae TaxID=2419771 RepID=A0A387BN69_9MICO|nr:hypothetical protein [Gryllotalpicola protaetiae]AYG03474.1 hypothetical protein D7I44_07955 [Gryllotalpicola protaetiae]